MRILFCCLGTHGFVYPAVGIALQLRHLGNEVAFATSPSFGTLLSQQGLQRISVQDLDGVGFQTSKWFVDSELRAQLAHVHRALRVFRPDVVVTSQLALAPMVVCSQEQRPLAVLGFAGFPFPASEAALKDSTSEFSRGNAYRFNSVVDFYLSARQVAGLDNRDGEAVARTIEASPLFGRLCLVQSVPEFICGMIAPQARLIGSCLWEPDEPDDDLRRWLEVDSEQPIVYVQPGRSFDEPSFWPTLLAAAGESAVRVVASTSRMDLPANPRASKSLFTKSHVPQGQILNHAKAVVCSATSTPVLGALTHGIPVITIPAGSGQFEMANECETTGVGISLHVRDLTCDVLGAALDQALTNSSMHQNCARIRRAFARINGPLAACKALLSLG